MSEQNADIQRNISMLLGDDKKGSSAGGTEDDFGRGSDALVRLRSLERVRVYRSDGSSYSVPYSDIDIVELSADGRDLSLLLRGGVQWVLQGESLQHLADLLDMHAVGKLCITPPAAIGESPYYRITNIDISLPQKTQQSIINIPKRG